MSTSRASKQKGIRKNAIQFAVYCFGYFLNFGSYVAVCGLQSSINIEESVGTLSLGIAYGVSFLTSLFVTPIFVRRFGCKYALLTGEVAHLLFVAANFYPAPYVMITVGVVLGFGEAMVWTALPMFSTYFGIQHGNYGTKNDAAYIRKCSGMLLGSLFLGQVFGCAMTYGFLYGGKMETGLPDISKMSTTTNFTAPSATDIAVNITTSDLLNTTQLEMNQEHTDTTPSITVVSTLPGGNDTGTNITGSVLLHSTQFDTQRDLTTPSSTNLSAQLFYQALSADDPFQYCGARDCQDPEVTEARIHNYVPADKTFLYILLSVFCVISTVGILLHALLLPATKPHTFKRRTKSNEKLNKEKENEVEKKETVGPISTLVATIRHTTSLMQILLVPLLIHGGLAYGFYLSELSRAFTSCLLGVEKVGLPLMIFATSCAASSFLFPTLINWFGRNKVVVGFLVLDLSNYTFCQLWRPQEDTLNLVFLIFVLFGITESGWKNCAWGMYADYFPANLDIALTIWNLYFTIGVAISFVWSPLLCVSSKIYIQSALLTTGVAGYGLAEFLYRRKKRKSYDKDSANILQEDESESLTN